VTGSALFVVEVRESVAEALTNSPGHGYVSPPQTLAQALELIGLLLGHPTALNGEGEDMWSHAIAGGQRSVKLRRMA
jgi:hypothetical protein